MMRLVCPFLLALVFFLSPGFSQNKSNFIKVATVDIDYVFKKLSEDPYLLKVIVKRTDEDFQAAEALAGELSRLKDRFSKTKQGSAEYNDLELKIAQKEQEIRTYFDRIPRTSVYDEKTLKAIYYYIKRVAELRGVSLLIEKNAAVIFSSEEAEITQDVMKSLLDVKSKLGL